MGDWVEKLSPEERVQWNETVRHYREEVLEAMESSAFVASIVTPAKTDIKFAVELGIAIMLEKPLVILVTPGAHCPPKLRLIADAVVDVDFETEEGREEFLRVMTEVKKKYVDI